MELDQNEKKMQESLEVAYLMLAMENPEVAVRSTELATRYLGENAPEKTLFSFYDTLKLTGTLSILNVDKMQVELHTMGMEFTQDDKQQIVEDLIEYGMFISKLYEAKVADISDDYKGAP